MSIAETSLDAYIQKKRDGTLTEDQEAVYQIIKKHGPISCKQTALKMNRFPNEISGRFTELRDQELIKIVDRKDGHRQYQVTQQE
jgi:Mn-dependent DtxR family transcriptional regulator